MTIQLENDGAQARWDSTFSALGRKYIPRGEQIASVDFSELPDEVVPKFSEMMRQAVARNITRTDNMPPNTCVRSWSRPVYPHERPAHWPLPNHGPPPSRDPEVRRMVEDARRLIADHRKSRDYVFPGCFSESASGLAARMQPT
jgi:hypothetical protein